MKEIVFATNNKYKLDEIRNIIQNSKVKSQKSKIKILSLNDINCLEELEETGNTLEANASQKALYVFNHYLNTPLPPLKRGIKGVFADDTGLEIEALNGRPGVYSARYAGLAKDFDDNIFKVLEELRIRNYELGIMDEEKWNRKACFRTVIALIIQNSKVKSQKSPVVSYFEGRVDGTIITEKRGTYGFGYDPIFMPNGYDLTFAEMSPEQKNSLSHRYFAIDKLLKSGRVI